MTEIRLWGSQEENGGGMGGSSTNNLYFGLGEIYSGASIPLSHLAQGSRLHITLLQHIYSFILLESFIEQNNIEKWQYHAELEGLES